MVEVQLLNRKTQFSALVERAVAGEKAIITQNGERKAVLVSFEEWQKLQPSANFGEHLLNCPLEIDDFLPRTKNDFRDVDL